MNDFHYAVVIGINLYHPRFKNLTAAHNDAQDFFQWVTSATGGGVRPETNAKLVLAELPTNPTAQQAQPTREAIHNALEKFKDLASKTSPVNWPKTRLYVYTAGHGIAPAPNDAALLAADADEHHLTRHISCTSILEFFARVQVFREVVLFADCCRSSPRNDIQRMPVDWNDDSIDNGGARRFLACGAMFNRKAYEDLKSPPDLRRGYFTKALMDGLKGGAAYGPGETITVAGLKSFIREHMRRATPPNSPAPLEPDFIDLSGDEITFGASGVTKGPERYRVIIEVRSVQVSLISIEPIGEVHPSSSDPAVFECSLPIGVYEVVPIGAPSSPPQEWLIKVKEGGVKYVL